MSETDSFIDEVTEEVRRDKLFAVFRKYGWIGILAIIGIVGGASWNEWQKAKAAAAAQGFGDALIAAIATGDAKARATAFEALDASGSQGRAAVQNFMIAAAAVEAGDPAKAATALRAVAENDAIGAAYRDLARLRLVLLNDASVDAAEREAILADLARPGGLYRTLAEEQQALALLAAGKTDEATAQLQALVIDAETPQRQRGRIADLLVALGVTPEEVPAMPTDALATESQ